VEFTRGVGEGDLLGLIVSLTCTRPTLYRAANKVQKVLRKGSDAT
jgi:hypothetical protein